MARLPEASLDQLFSHAHSFSKYLQRDVDDGLLMAVADLAKLGPTSMNSCPGRFVFVKTADGKERLRAHLSPGNVEKTMAAPVTVIIAYDLEFYEKFAKLSPPGKARDSFVGKPERIESTAIMSATLQAGWLIMAARAFGLDAGPMGGFRPAGVDESFFAGTPLRSLLLCNLGYADGDQKRPRQPRLDFSEFCTFA